MIAAILDECRKDPSAPTVLQQLVERSEFDLRLRSECCVILAIIDRDRYWDVLASFIATYRGSEEVLPVIYALGQRYSPQVTPIWYVSSIGVLVYPAAPVNDSRVGEFLLALAGNKGYSPRARQAALAALSESLENDAIASAILQLVTAEEPEYRGFAVRSIGNGAARLSDPVRNAAAESLAFRIAVEQDRTVKTMCWESLILLGTDRSLEVAFEIADAEGGSQRYQVFDLMAKRNIHIPPGLELRVLARALDWLSQAEEYLEFSRIADKIRFLVSKKQFSQPGIKNLEERLVILNETETDLLRRKEYGDLIKAVRLERREE